MACGAQTGNMLRQGVDKLVHPGDLWLHVHAYPSSRAVAAAMGPIQAMMVRWCGLPAIPTRLRTVDEEVKHTASKPPDLIMSRISALGGAARTVR